MIGRRRSIAVFATTAAALLLASVSPAWSQSEKPSEPVLLPGDQAPRVTVGTWLKGPRIGTLQKGHVYVVEFWASWCGPCKKQLPHTIGLASRYGSRVAFLGVGVWDRPGPLAEYAKNLHLPHNYSLATDLIPDTVLAEESMRVFARRSMEEGGMSSNWLVRSKMNLWGIPVCFLVDQKGRIAWIGEPASLDRPLKLVLNHTWDLATARKQATKVVAKLGKLGK